MKKILKNPTSVNQQGYNGVDLSQLVDFTSSVGHVVPVMWDFLQPGDKIRLQDSLLTRTSPLLSSAFATIEENVRYFFVPISQIFKPFEQTFNGIQDYGSDFYSSIIQASGTGGTNGFSDKLPTCTIIQLLDYLATVSDYEETVRLLEAIGLPMAKIFDLLQNADTSYLTHSINLLPFLAYNKIWYDFFRDTDRIPNDPRCYNMDSFVQYSITNNPAKVAERLPYVLKLRNCPAVRDVQNNIFVSPMFGEQGVGGDMQSTLTRVNQWLTSSTPTLQNSGNTTDNQLPTNVSSSAGPTAVSTINTAQMRSMFAVEKLLEVTRRAGKHYDAQILAHFGVDVPTGVDGECFEIGKHMQKLEIGAVISTADTSDNFTGAPLGEIAGKGYQSDSSGRFEFEAKTHGIVMAVYYARPHYVYEQNGFDKKLLYTRVSDFPRVEFENLGMQPVFQLNQDLTSVASSNSNINGWQYRYSEVKSASNRLFAGLRRQLNMWAVSRSANYKTADSFYVSPYDINQILVVPYEPEVPIFTEDNRNQEMKGTNDNLFWSDPLLHQLSISYQKATKLSTYGLSKL